MNPRLQKTLICRCHSDKIFISGSTRSCHSQEMQKIYLLVCTDCDRLDLAILCCLCHGWWRVIICGIDPISTKLFRYGPDFFQINQKWSIKTLHYKPFVWKILSFCRHFQHVFYLMIFCCIYFNRNQSPITQVMAWHQIGGKPLPEPNVVQIQDAIWCQKAIMC